MRVPNRQKQAFRANRCAWVLVSALFGALIGVLRSMIFWGAMHASWTPHGNLIFVLLLPLLKPEITWFVNNNEWTVGRAVAFTGLLIGGSAAATSFVVLAVFAAVRALSYVFTRR